MHVVGVKDKKTMRGKTILAICPTTIAVVKNTGAWNGGPADESRREGKSPTGKKKSAATSKKALSEKIKT